MFRTIKNHPFAVEAFFKQSVVLTFAVPKEELQDKIPPCLSLDLFQDTWAFIAVAMVQTTGLRPKGFPAFMGNDFFLVGYRIFVRFTNKEGKKRRGLYILKSETDSKKMEKLGNLFTQYRYTTIDFRASQEANHCIFHSQKAPFHLVFDKSEEEVALPPHSPFADWKEARKFAGPLPFTFSYLPELDQVLIVEGVRVNWTPRPVAVREFDFPFLETLKLNGLQLANAFVLENIPYYWKKGVLEK